MRDELRHTFVLAIGTGASSLFRIAYAVYVGRVLGPADYATFYAALTVILLFATALAPISGTVSRFVSLYHARGDRGALAGLRQISQSSVRRLALGLLIVGVVAALALGRPLAFDSVWVPLLVAVTLPVNLLLDLPRGFLRGNLSFPAYSLHLVVEAILRLLLCVVLLLRFATADAALAAYFAAAVVVLPLGTWLMRNIGSDAVPERSQEGALRRFALNLFAVALVGALLQNIDVLFVRGLFADVDAGLYSAASALAKVVGLIFMPFGVLLLPMLTGRFSSGRGVVAPLLATMGGFAAIALAAVLALKVWGRQLLSLLYGSEFEAAAPLIVPLGSAMVFALLSIMIGQAFTAMDRFRFVPAYFASLGIVLGALWWGRGSLQTVASGFWRSQLLVALLMFGLFVVSARSLTPTGERS